jgi:hypothetical protein
LRSERDKIIVGRNASDGHWIYFSVSDSADSGTIVDFVQNRERLSLGQTRQKLRRWLAAGSTSGSTGGSANGSALLGSASGSANGSALLGSANGSALPPERPRLNLRLEPLDRSRAALLGGWALTRPVASHPYLEGARRISRDLLAAERFAGRIRTDGRRNAIFPHVDGAGEVCGWEIKNASFTGFAEGGRKGLWLSKEFPGDSGLVVAESAIDALSHAALFPDAAARYASTGGGWGTAAADLLRQAAGRLPPEGQIILAFDSDDAGREYVAKARDALAGLPQSVEVHLPPGEERDWNDVLRESRQLSQSPSKQKPSI